MSANGHRPTPTEPEVLRAEIAQTRADLGETVSALAAKVDVKARAQQMRGELTDRVRDTAGEVGHRVRDTAGEVRHRIARTGEQVGTWPLIGGAAALTLLLVGLAYRRRWVGR
jgi:LPXTG-motif cell wall-anchored protein